MQYLGGKTRIAKRLVEVMLPIVAGRPFWDPLCGGLSVSVALVRAGLRGLVSDANPALIALYQAVAAGWDPPAVVTEDDYRAARALPDTDPRKAFVGFGCSFGGKWFGGYARARAESDRRTVEGYAGYARNGLRRDLALLTESGCQILCADFLAIEPRPTPFVLYLDPPYRGTEGYDAVAPFDHARFYERVAQWARYTDVFTSEYGMPWGRLAVELYPNQTLAGRGAQGNRKPERLYRYGPDRLLDQVML